MSIRNVLLATGTTGEGGRGSRMLNHRIILSRTIQNKIFLSFCVYHKCPFRCWYTVDNMKNHEAPTRASINKTVQGQCHNVRKGTVIKTAFDCHAPIKYMHIIS